METNEVEDDLFNEIMTIAIDLDCENSRALPCSDPDAFSAWVEYSILGKFYPDYDNVEFEDFHDDWLEENVDELIGDPLTTGEIWSRADMIRIDFINTYPEYEEKIDDFFVCRVLALAFEDVVLASLANFDVTNAQIPGSPSNITAEPDGYYSEGIKWNPPFGPVVPNSLHYITEVKTKFTSPAIFNWSSRPNQFSQYQTFLNQNQYQGTAPNFLYLILPENVAIDESIIDACTSQNIMLVSSSVEINSWDSDMVRVTSPVAHNQWDLTYYSYQFETMIKLFPTNGIKNHFNYDYVNFQEALEIRAAAFEASFLQNGGNSGSCPDE